MALNTFSIELASTAYNCLSSFICNDIDISKLWNSFKYSFAGKWIDILKEVHYIYKIAMGRNENINIQVSRQNNAV